MNKHRLNLIEDIPQSISQVICLRVPPGLFKAFDLYTYNSDQSSLTYN